MHNSAWSISFRLKPPSPRIPEKHIFSWSFFFHLGVCSFRILDRVHRLGSIAGRERSAVRGPWIWASLIEHLGGFYLLEMSVEEEDAARLVVAGEEIADSCASVRWLREAFGE